MNRLNYKTNKELTTSADSTAYKFCSRCKLVKPDLTLLSADEADDFLITHYNDRVCVSLNDCTTSTAPLKSRLLFWWNKVRGRK